jgi:type IV pilus assembly protein PilO
MAPLKDLSAHTANLSQTHKVILGIVLGILVGVLYWQFLLKSEWAARSEAQAELLRLKAEAEQTRRIAEQRPRMEQEIRLLETRLRQAVRQLPTEKEIPSLLQRIAGLGLETDLDVALFKPGALVPKEFYAEVPVQLKVIGTYHDLGLLFERLGRLERIVNIGDLAIRPAAKGQKTKSSIQADINVVTYTYLTAAMKIDAIPVGAKSGDATRTPQ